MSDTKKFREDKQGRFICPHCGKPIEEISLTFYEAARWKWNGKTRQYEQTPTNGDTSYNCGHCGKKIGRAMEEELKE